MLKSEGKARLGASLRRAAPFPYDLPPMRGNARSAGAFVFDKKGRRFVSSKIVVFLRSDIGLTGRGHHTARRRCDG
jgi:hypothetical protein